MKRCAILATLVVSSIVTMPALSAAPASADAGETSEAALAQLNLYKAGAAYQALVEARLPSKAISRPDPLLDRLMVDRAAIDGSLSRLSTLVQRVVGDPTTPNRGRYRLLLATYSETIGALSAAEQQYRALAGDAGIAAEDRLSARFGVARLQMIADPAAALTTLESINSHDVPPASAWELSLLTSRAASMAGQADITASALNRAWSEAALAPLTAAAPAHVAADRALAAARVGDRKALIGMLAIDRFNRNANAGQPTLVANLPVCGRDGILAQDRVVIDVAHLPAAGRPSVTLVWASRPGIAGPFLNAAQQSAISVSDGRVGMFALSCRSVPSPEYAVRVTLDDAIVGWMTGLGAYPLFFSGEDSNPSALASMLAQRQARYGPNSVMLLPVLNQMMRETMAQDFEANSRKQIEVISSQISQILSANRASAEFLAIWQMQLVGMQILAQTKTVAEGQAEMQALMVKAARNPNLSLDLIYALTTSMTNVSLAASFRISLLSATFDLLKQKAPPGDPRTAAIAIRLHAARQSVGDDSGGQAVAQSLGMPKDLCLFSKPALHFLSSNITGDDYPGDLAFMRAPGMTEIEFDLDPTGTARNARIILADPPYVFDEVTLARAPTIHYDPARIGGAVSSCRGYTQAVRWQLPY
jgi:hypothetical protein